MNYTKKIYVIYITFSRSAYETSFGSLTLVAKNKHVANK